MRHIRLVLYFIVGLMLGSISVFSYAGSSPASWTYQTGGRSGKSGDVVCAPNSFSSATDYEYNGLVYTGWCMSGTQKLSQVSKYMSCSGIGGTETGSRTGGMTCVCPGTQVPDGGVCKEPNPCSGKAGWYDNGGNPQMVQLPGSSWYEGKGSSVPQTMCIDGCTADMKQNLNTQVTGGGYWGAETNPVYSGQSCSSNPNGTNGTTDKRMPKDSDEKKCVDAGKAFGYVNEKVVCVTPDEKGGTATKKTETKNADGTTTKTETTTNISCNAEGACSTTTTTTTTVINSDGTTASTKTETKKEESGGGSGTGTPETTSFCKENPSSPLCKSGTFSGACSQEPECTGDPVQCATAKSVFKTKCALEASQEVAAKGQALMDGTDQEVKDALARKEISVPQISTSDTGGGSCPADRAVSVGDRVVMIPYSSVCGGMAMMRIALLAIASFIAAMILIGGVK